MQAIAVLYTTETIADHPIQRFSRAMEDLRNWLVELETTQDHVSVTRQMTEWYGSFMRLYNALERCISGLPKHSRTRLLLQEILSITPMERLTSRAKRTQYSDRKALEQLQDQMMEVGWRFRKLLDQVIEELANEIITDLCDSENAKEIRKNMLALRSDRDRFQGLTRRAALSAFYALDSDQDYGYLKGKYCQGAQSPSLKIIEGSMHQHENELLGQLVSSMDFIPEVVTVIRNRYQEPLRILLRIKQSMNQP